VHRRRPGVEQDGRARLDQLGRRAADPVLEPGLPAGARGEPVLRDVDGGRTAADPGDQPAALQLVEVAPHGHLAHAQAGGQVVELRRPRVADEPQRHVETLRHGHDGYFHTLLIDL
jgi:hypothetical protein